MPAYRATMIFNWGRYGWTETWYLTAGDITLAQRRMSAPATTRSHLLGAGALLEAVRISDTAIGGDSLLVGSDGTWKSDDAAADAPWNAILARVEATDKHRRQMWLRGVPDSWIGLDPVTKKNTMPAKARQAFQAFLAAVMEAPSPLQLQVYNKQGQGGTGVAITAQVLDVASGYTTFSVANSTAEVGEKALMKRWKGPDKKTLNKTYHVVKKDATTVTLSLPFVLIPTPGANFGGLLFPRNPTYTNVTDGIILRVNKRNTGRAFFVSRGRRSNKQA